VVRSRHWSKELITISAAVVDGNRAGCPGLDGGAPAAVQKPKRPGDPMPGVLDVTLTSDPARRNVQCLRMPWSTATGNRTLMVGCCGQGCDGDAGWAGAGAVPRWLVPDVSVLCAGRQSLVGGAGGVDWQSFAGRPNLNSQPFETAALNSLPASAEPPAVIISPAQLCLAPGCQCWWRGCVAQLTRAVRVEWDEEGDMGRQAWPVLGEEPVSIRAYTGKE